MKARVVNKRSKYYGKIVNVRKMEEHIVKISVNGKYAECEFDFDMPWMLANQIKEVVRKFYQED